MQRKNIYLDNAATSGKKPEAVYQAVNEALREACGNPGRSGHAVSLAAGRIVETARMNCARLLGADDARRIVFGANATDALNLAIHGVVTPGSHVITSSLEHNSVARPLEECRRTRDVTVTKLPTSLDAGVDARDVANAIGENTAMVVVSHCSNVTGTITDVGAIGRVCREAKVPLLVDAAQSVGTIPIDVQEMNIDLLAFPGHKSLLGPQGTGGLYIAPGKDLSPLKQGGTGSRSERLTMPEELPDRYEAGTLNVPGIAGLLAGIRFLMENSEQGESNGKRIANEERRLTRRLIFGLKEIRKVRLYGAQEQGTCGAVVSFTIEGQEPQDVAMVLDQVFGIAVRAGLHCSPDAHRMLGTLESGGTIRVSPGYGNNEEEIDALLEAIESIAGE